MSDIEKMRKEIESLQSQLHVVVSVLKKMTEEHHKRARGEDTLLLQAEVQQEVGFLEREQKKQASQ